MQYTFPGFIDVHVHFRDPGMTDAETVASGLACAKRGGFAAVVTMPNTSPACDGPEGIAYQLSRREATGDASLPLLMPSAAITRGRLGRELADLERSADAGAAFFTDDGAFVEDDKLMEAAMRKAADLDMAVCQHAMTYRNFPLRRPGVIRDCPLARSLGLDIVPVEVETDAIRRDLSICRETGCRLHIQHISTAEGVALVRAAQDEGLPVTAEATPHHLLFACDELEKDDANFKMAPPLGNREDRAELRRAVKEGAFMFATDHAPHPAATKSRGFAASANGIIGLETAIAATYRAMVEEEKMPIETWARAWYEMPRWVLSAQCRGKIAALPSTVIEVGVTREWDLAESASLSRNCPYDRLSSTCWPVLGGNQK